MTSWQTMMQQTSVKNQSVIAGTIAAAATSNVRMQENATEKASTTYPWQYMIPSSGILTVRDIQTSNALASFDRDPSKMTFASVAMWPYFYARPLSMSIVSHLHSVRIMLDTQRMFLQRYAPNNSTLLQRFFADYIAVNPLPSPTYESMEDRGYGFDEDGFPREDPNAPPRPDPVLTARDWISSFCNGGYATVRMLLEQHKDQLSRISTLDEMASQGMDVHEFITTVFYPGPTRAAVPLPAGLVLFEGRSNASAKTRILASITRREPFSTTWHPNVALSFLRPGIVKTMNVFMSQAILNPYRVDASSHASVLFVHRVMTPDILAADVQGTDTEMESIPTYYECEVIIQPFVKTHVVAQRVLLIHYDVILKEKAGPPQALLVHTMFTHLFLGATCPCGFHE
jgi:hypothetical protein